MQIADKSYHDVSIWLQRVTYTVTVSDSKPWAGRSSIAGWLLKGMYRIATVYCILNLYPITHVCVII